MSLFNRLFRPSLYRDSIEQLENAVRARNLAVLQAEQARWALEENELNVVHQNRKIERLAEEISAAAKAGHISKRQLSVVRPHLSDTTLQSLG